MTSSLGRDPDAAALAHHRTGAGQAGAVTVTTPIARGTPCSTRTTTDSDHPGNRGYLCAPCRRSNGEPLGHDVVVAALRRDTQPAPSGVNPPSGVNR
jgi:hypothetical protein